MPDTLRGCLSLMVSVKVTDWEAQSFLLNGKGSTDISKRALKSRIGRRDIYKGMRSLSQEAFKQSGGGDLSSGVL